MDTSGRLEHDWFPRALPSNVGVGERSWIYSSFAFVHCEARKPDAVRIGNNTGVYNGTFFDLGATAEVRVGDFCTLVGAIIRTHGRVEIGNYSFIAHEVVIADTPWAVPPTGASLPGGEDINSMPIRLAENCWVGMGAVLLSGTDLGAGCVVGAGAVVDFAAPPYSIIAGNPAQIVASAR